jgi:uncharacterized protein involved in exopolysaccharide biosynthesis
MSKGRQALSDPAEDDDEPVHLTELLLPAVSGWRLLLLVPLAVGALALGLTYLVPPVFTARTTFLPPQQQQSQIPSGLGQLGALAGIAGGSSLLKSPADQYVALMQSVNASDSIIDRFGLMRVYEADYRFQARRMLALNVRISVGKKDGLITLEVDDTDPQRASDIANQFVQELRRMTTELGLTEAQQRRMFFEAQLARASEQLNKAQRALQSSGFGPGALRTEPRVAADSYARLRAETTTAEIKLQTLRRALADSAPEVQQQLAIVSALRAQVSKLEDSATNSTSGEADYVGKYREFKYQETLFEIFARQFEQARLDEAREGALVQIVDVAQKPEWKSKPKRAQAAGISALVALALTLAYLYLRHAMRRAADDPEAAQRLAALRAAIRTDSNPT